MSLSTSASRAFRRIESFALRRPTAGEDFPASTGDILPVDVALDPSCPFGSVWNSESSECSDDSDEDVRGLLDCPDMRESLNPEPPEWLCSYSRLI